MVQSPELAGGAGFTFADQVAARYLAALLLGSAAQGLTERQVVRVALEQRDAGEPLDDLVVDAVAPNGSVARLSLQVKREITISAGPTNTDFRDIIRDSWATIDKPNFRAGVDRLGAVVGPSTAVGKWRNLVALAEFARASATPADFAARFAPGGSASQQHCAILADLQTITIDLGRPAAFEDMHALLRHFVMLRFDTLHEGAADDLSTIVLLEQALASGYDGQAVALLERLRGLVRRGAGAARTWDRGGLRLEVAPWFKLAIARSLAADIEKLIAEVRHAAASISDQIGDTTIDRPGIRANVAAAFTEHQLVALRGLPGSGKSVILRREIEDALAAGPVILLKADRLAGNSWAQYATAHGLQELDPAKLMMEIAAVGTPTLFIDGLDRIEKAQRGIVLDLFHALEREPKLDGWRVLATLRDSGVEPVRTWLPETLDGGRMASIEVKPLDNAEARSLAEARPHLRPLLFGSEPVRTLIRRPFFAKILDAPSRSAGDTPRSEIELMRQWWERGGFDAEGSEARLRQRTLLRLVRVRALRPDAPVSLDSLDEALLSSVDVLIADGVLDSTGDCHFVRFAHDIYFEWSFTQLLAAAGADWVEQLKSTGEPPVIGRSISLRAQSIFVSDTDAWRAALVALADPTLRSQWRRVWLLAPLGHPEFMLYADEFQTALWADDQALLRSALVWFQAQQIVPNTGILDGTIGDFADHDVRLRAADQLGWPDDMLIWGRLLHFLDQRSALIPHRLLPLVLTLFEVWQNAFSNIPNAVSTMVIAHAANWLAELERRHAQSGRFQRGGDDAPADPWSDVEDTDEFESAVRRLVLRAAPTENDRVAAYLREFRDEEAVSLKTSEDTISFAPLLSRTHPSDLVDFSLNHFRCELPEDHQRRRLEEDRRDAEYREELRSRPRESLSRSEEMSLSSPNLGYWGPDHWDWDALALERDMTAYFPASPLHQPFQALFENAPDEALRLVRSMSNHAVEAWRQLHRLQPSSGTPVPIEIEFPWGHQVFWGGAREYLWSRGLWAPAPLASAYLALDRWALDLMAADEDGDALIQRIVRDHHSIASLGIALNVALSRPAVTPVNEALVTAQRLWRADVGRFAQEASIRSSSQIGFDRTLRQDAEAVEALNTHEVRSREIRTLATMHVLQVDAGAAQCARDSILAFADSPDFELEEARIHPDAREHALENARTFAAWGDITNYQLVDVPDEPAQKAVVMENPIASEPSVQERLQESQVNFQMMALFNWAENSFANNSLADTMTVERGIENVRSLDADDLFEPGLDDEFVSLKRGAVTGVAAVIVAFVADSSEVDWARSVLSRAAHCGEEGGPVWSSVGVVPWHHIIFVARAAAADLRRDPESRQRAVDLLSTLIHPLDSVSLETSGLLSSLWDVAPHVCWVGLGLGLELCIIGPDEMGSGSIHDPSASAEVRKQKLDVALTLLDRAPQPLPTPPRPWVHTEAGDRRRLNEIRDDDDLALHWRAADGWWKSKRAGSILSKQPPRKILAAGFEQQFLPYCEIMLSWTIERRAPKWASRSREIKRSDVLEWTDQFASTLGDLIGHLNGDRSKNSFINPICDIADDEECFDFLAPLVRVFICEHVLDSPAVSSMTPMVLEHSLDRLLNASQFTPTAYRAGEMYGFSMPKLARWLMFVGVERADLAKRYANGDWSEIEVILPTVDRFVRAAGWAPVVMQNYLTLAERARTYFPPDAFADAILAALEVDADLAARWRGTMIGARIASRVQEIADNASPLPLTLGRKLLRILDILIDQGDRRSAALQIGPAFRDLRTGVSNDFSRM